MIALAELARFYPKAKPEWLQAMARLAPILCQHYKMDRLEWVHFAGQIGHETNGLSLGGMRESMAYSAPRMKEIFRYRLTLALKQNTLGVRDKYGTLDRLCRGLVGQPETLAALVYGGREGTPVGCGRYIGRGPTQITHLNNYREIGKEIARQPVGEKVDLVENPELLELPEWGVRSAFADWHLKNLRKYAWVDDVDRVSAKLNTGSAEKIKITNGLDSRRRWVAKAKGVWPAATDDQVRAARMLAEGDIGPDVEALQQRLTDLGYPVGAIDGRWGLLTSRALRNFQAEHGLVVDGKLGPRTKDALDASAPADLGERSEITAKDLSERGSTTVKVAEQTKGVGRSLAFLGVSAGGVTTLSDAVGLFNQTRANFDQLSDILLWFKTPIGLLALVMIVVAFAGWRIATWAERIIENRVQAAKLGVHLGR